VLARTGIDPGLIMILGGILLISGVLVIRYAES
jgi:LPXTG-motif cell wall-anchored protein